MPIIPHERPPHEPHPRHRRDRVPHRFAQPLGRHRHRHDGGVFAGPGGGGLGADRAQLELQKETLRWLREAHTAGHLNFIGNIEAKEAIKGGGILAKLGALLLMPTLKKLGKCLDVTEYGGAPLLGVNGCCIISHGSSNAKSICSAIGVANDYVRGDVLAHIRDTLAKEEILTNDGEKN